LAGREERLLYIARGGQQVFGARGIALAVRITELEDFDEIQVDGANQPILEP
jgi:hypothetical protein